MVRGFQEKAMALDLAARWNREVEGILASRFSQSEKLEEMFVCAVTGHGKMQCFCTISVEFTGTLKPDMSSSSVKE